MRRRLVSVKVQESSWRRCFTWSNIWYTKPIKREIYPYDKVLVWSRQSGTKSVLQFSKALRFMIQIYWSLSRDLWFIDARWSIVFKDLIVNLLYTFSTTFFCKDYVITVHKIMFRSKSLRRIYNFKLRSERSFIINVVDLADRVWTRKVLKNFTVPSVEYQIHPFC